MKRGGRGVKLTPPPRKNTFKKPSLIRVKTHKADNPRRVITNGCGTAVKNLSIFVKKWLFPKFLEIESRL